MNLPLKWHGGKYYLAAKIVRLMPPHLHYVEPFFGGGAVLMARDPENRNCWLFPHQGVSEVANDLNDRLINFWRVLQSPELFEAFHRRAQAIPVSRSQWEKAHAHVHDDDPVASALAFFVDCRQSRSGLMTSFTAVTRNRTRRRMNGNVSEWLSAVDGLPEVHARLRRVLIQKMPALDIIKREDTPGTLFYCDPPYLHETRTSKDAYSFEMNEEEHKDLLAILFESKRQTPWPKALLANSTSQTWSPPFSSVACWRRPSHPAVARATCGFSWSFWVVWSRSGFFSVSSGPSRPATSAGGNFSQTRTAAL